MPFYQGVTAIEEPDTNRDEQLEEAKASSPKWYACPQPMPDGEDGCFTCGKPLPAVAMRRARLLGALGVR